MSVARCRPVCPGPHQLDQHATGDRIPHATPRVAIRHHDAAVGRELDDVRFVLGKHSPSVEVLWQLERPTKTAEIRTANKTPACLPANPRIEPIGWPPLLSDHRCKVRLSRRHA